MVTYRSTMAQPNQYVEVLERMNMVGMAVQILDAIPEAESEGPTSGRESLPTTLHEGKARTHPFPCTIQIALVLLARSGAPKGTILELSSLSSCQMCNCLKSLAN
jgi:hypothetical protein